MTWRQKEGQPPPEKLLDHLQRTLLMSREGFRLKPIFAELLKYLGEGQTLQKWNAWDPPRLPVDGAKVRFARMFQKKLKQYDPTLENSARRRKTCMITC